MGGKTGIREPTKIRNTCVPSIPSPGQLNWDHLGNSCGSSQVGESDGEGDTATPARRLGAGPGEPGHSWPSRVRPVPGSPGPVWGMNEDTCAGLLPAPKRASFLSRGPSLGPCPEETEARAPLLKPGPRKTGSPGGRPAGPQALGRGWGGQEEGKGRRAGPDRRLSLPQRRASPCPVLTRPPASLTWSPRWAAPRGLCFCWLCSCISHQLLLPPSWCGSESQALDRTGKE